MEKLSKQQKYANRLKGKPAPWINSIRYKEICEKISKAKKGIKNPKASLKLKGKKKTKGHKEKLRQAKLKNPTNYWLGKKRPGIGKIMSKNNKGKPLSDKHKKKLSIALKGRIFSIETRKKMSEARKGDKSSLWKGGVSKVNKRIRAGIEFANWRKKVFERDDYTCRKCNKRSGYLIPHHIENFHNNIEKRFDINNGITLHKRCHTEFHKIYGFKNNNKEQIENYTSF
jgi:hypothetical protein